jgi:hypothetical protein
VAWTRRLREESDPTVPSVVAPGSHVVPVEHPDVLLARCRAESGRSSAASHAAVGAWASYQGYIVITSVAVRADIGKSAERGHHDPAGP